MSGSPQPEPSPTITLNRPEAESIRRMLARCELELRHVAAGHPFNADQMRNVAETLGKHIAIIDQELRA